LLVARELGTEKEQKKVIPVKAVKAYGGVHIYFHSLLILALDESE